MNKEERVVKYINSSDDFVVDGKRYCENDFYNDVEDLAKENQRYKEAFDKAIKFIDNYMYENYCYAGSEDRLKDILNEAIDE